MSRPNLSLVPCPCCGQTLAIATPTDDGLWLWTCPCGAEYEGSSDPSLGTLLTETTTLPPHTTPDDPPSALFVAAVLRGLGLTDDDLRALARGARLEVVR